jgi:hypothetical protein
MLHTYFTMVCKGLKIPTFPFQRLINFIHIETSSPVVGEGIQIDICVRTLYPWGSGLEEILHISLCVARGDWMGTREESGYNRFSTSPCLS